MVRYFIASKTKTMESAYPNSLKRFLRHTSHPNVSIVILVEQRNYDERGVGLQKSCKSQKDKPTLHNRLRTILALIKSPHTTAASSPLTSHAHHDQPQLLCLWSILQNYSQLIRRLAGLVASIYLSIYFLATLLLRIVIWVTQGSSNWACLHHSGQL